MSQNENSIKQARQDYIMNMPIIESTPTPTDLGDDNQNLIGEEKEFFADGIVQALLIILDKEQIGKRTL